MMTSWQTASAWDWLSTALMMIGFTILLGLAAYLVFALVAGDGGRAPHDDLDRLVPSRPSADDGYIRPLAS